MAERATRAVAGGRPAASVTIGLLGPTIVSRDGNEIAPGPLRQRALLALLALNARRTVSLDAIVDALWADEVPDRPEVSVRSYVSNLRRVLEPDRATRSAQGLLVTDGSGYRIEVPDDAVDALRFAIHVTSALRGERTGDALGALDAAVAALALRRGPALVDVQGAPFAVAAATRLDADADRVELVRLRALVDLGHHAEALGELESRHARDVTDEATTGLLMRSLYALGQPTEALRRYADVRRGLTDRGLLPSPALQGLERAVLQHALPDRSNEGTAPHPAGSAARSPAGIERPESLVGRREVWDRLVDAVARPDPLAAWVVVRGESGAGKTFVIESLAAAFSGPVLWGRGHRDDDQAALALWREAMSELGVEHVDDVTTQAMEIRDRLPAAAGAGRVLVLLDDVQWADPDSLRLLRLLAGESRRLPATFVLALRPNDVGDELQSTVAEIVRQPDVTAIELPPFGDDDVGELAARLGVPLDPEETTTLLAASNGNALLVRELLRLPPERRTGSLPRGVTAIVAARLERMPAPTVEVLRLAALAGDTIDVELLGRVLDLDAFSVLERLEPAVAAAVLDEAMRFRHVALRDAVLLGLDRSEARLLHLQLADTMAADPGRWRAARVVHHRAAARPLGEHDALVESVRQAAADAAVVGAFAEQARLLGVALADDALDVKTRLEFTIDVAEAFGRAGADLDTQTHTITALDLAETTGDRRSATRAIAVLGRGGGAWYWVPFGQHPVDLLGRIERAATYADDADRSLILATLAVGEAYGPDPTRPGRLAQEALELARRAGDPVVVAEALIAASWAGFGTAPAAELLALADELDAVGDVLAPERQLLRPAFRLSASLRQSDLAAMAAALNAGEVLAHTLHRPAFDATFGWARATLLAAGGDLRAASDAADRAGELHQRTQVYGAILARHLVAIHHADQAGDLALAGAEADAIATMDDHGDLYQLRTATARGDLVSAGGNAGAIPPDLHAIEARLATVLAEPPAWHRTSRLSLIGSLASDLGLRDLGGEIARALGPYADELIAPGTALVCAGPAALVLARLDALDGRADDAIDRLRAALDRAIATGLRGWEAPILVELADRLHDRGDRAGARAGAERALVLARRIGQAGVAARAAKRLA